MVLIDTWWNVNIARSSYINATTLVLIDTWWNVNITFKAKYVANVTVLIDTWWNVNRFIVAGVFPVALQF